MPAKPCCSNLYIHKGAFPIDCDEKIKKLLLKIRLCVQFKSICIIFLYILKTKANQPNKTNPHTKNPTNPSQKPPRSIPIFTTVTKAKAGSVPLADIPYH